MTAIASLDRAVDPLLGIARLDDVSVAATALSAVPELSAPATTVVSMPATYAGGMPSVGTSRGRGRTGQTSPSRLADERDLLTPELFRRRDDSPDEAGWHAAVNELVELHLPLARSIANRYRTQHGDHADLVQVACLGLVKAVLRFRPDVGAPFVSFAVPTITGEVRRYFRDHAWDIRPPRHLQELRPDVDRAGQELAQELGRSPGSAEIAARLDVPEREVLATQRAVSTGLNMHSLEALADASPSLSLRETIGALDLDLEFVTERLSLRPLVAALPERDRRILVLRYAEELTQRQIATELGLSQTQVCRLLTRILADLRVRLEDPAVDD